MDMPILVDAALQHYGGHHRHGDARNDVQAMFLGGLRTLAAPTSKLNQINILFLGFQFLKE